MKRFVLTVVVAALSMAGPLSLAGASVTIGQTDPQIPPPMSSCAGVVAQAMAQPTVTSGNSYVVPATVQQGAITAWSHNAFSAANQPVTMKVFRLVGGTTYRVVGHDGPRTLSGPGLVTFSGISVPVQAGDVLGLNSGTGSGFVQCMFVAAGDTMLYANPSDAADGQEVAFTTVPDRRPNISAVVAPTNTFTLGQITRNKKKGTATLTATVPNPGDLTASGNGVKAATSKAVGAGPAQLLIKAKGKKKKQLNKKGKVKVTLNVAYTPTGGDPATQPETVKLKKKV